MLSAAYLTTLTIVSFVICFGVLVNFIVKIFGFKFYGSTIIPLIVIFVLCYLFALVPNLHPIEGFVDGKPEFGSNYILVSIAVSIFDAIKMFAISFDKDVIINYYAANGAYRLFSVGYVLTSISALVFASISIIVFTIKTFWARIKNVWFSLFSNRDVCYIFSDPKVPIAATLGEDLLKKKKIVIMVVTRSSQKTQEGTEYKDSLLMKGFDVRTENFSTGICRVIFRRFGKGKRTFVYGIFSDDNLSISLANNFQDTILKSEKRKYTRLYTLSHKKEKLEKSVNLLTKAVKSLEELAEKTEKDNKKLLKLKFELAKENESFISLKKDILTAYRNFKVFVTYHEADIDLNNNYSKKTKSIINTLSEYDIISTEFILNNPIDLFVDVDHLEEVEEGSMNVTFLGFGKINRPIFEKMTSAYQLWGDNVHKVTYSILDRDSNQLADFCNNEYTSEKNKDTKVPFLYKVQSDCDHEDLTEFNTIERYVERISKNKSRFTKNGFEHFVISVCDTNRDIKIATHLRKAIYKYVKENLERCRIYVRISNETLAKNFINNNDKGTIFELADYNKQYLYDKKNKSPDVPVIVFGESALMSDYITNRYDKFIQLAIGAQKSYSVTTGNEEEDYINAEIKINESKKLGLLQNICAAYNMHIKTKLLGYHLDYNFDVSQNSHNIHELDFGFNAKVNSCAFPDKVDIKNNIIKLAQLEHNRWVAASYALHKFSKWDKDEFIKLNQELNKKGDIDVSKGFKTRLGDSMHACMLTNSRLYELRTSLNESTFDGVSQSDIEEQSYKLVFSNDIVQLREMLKSLIRQSKIK